MKSTSENKDRYTYKPVLFRRWDHSRCEFYFRDDPESTVNYDPHKLWRIASADRNTRFFNAILTTTLLFLPNLAIMDSARCIFALTKKSPNFCYTALPFSSNAKATAKILVPITFFTSYVFQPKITLKEIRQNLDRSEYARDDFYSRLER